MLLALNVVGAAVFAGFAAQKLSHNTAASVDIGLAVFCFVVVLLRLHDEH